MVDVATLALEARTDGLLKAEAALDRVTASAVKTDAAGDNLKTSFDGVSTASSSLADQINRMVGVSDKAAQSAKESAAAFDEHMRAAESLRAAYDPLYAATSKYESALERVNAAERAGAISAREAERFRELATVQFNQATAAANTHAVALGRVRGHAQGTAGGFQNLGFQVQDMAVQIGAGTSATQALGQQLPQLLSGFGMIGIAVGTLSAVLIPLAGHFLTMEADAVSLDDAMDELSDSIGQYEEYTIRAATSTAELSETFGVFASQIQGFSEFMAGVALDQTFDNLAASLEPLKGGLADVEVQMQNVARAKALVASIPLEDAEARLMAQEALDLYIDQLNQSAGALGLNSAQAAELLSAMDSLGRAKTMQEIASAAGVAQGILEGIRNETGKLPAPLRDAAAALDKMAAEAAQAYTTAAKLPPILDAARAAAGAAAGAVAGIGNAAAGAVGQVRGLAQAMWDAAQARISASKWVDSMQPGGTGDLAAQYAQYGAGRRAAEQATQKTVEFSGAVPFVAGAGAGGGGGGGGGGGDDGFQSRLDALMEGLQTERDTVDQWYAESMEILNDRRAEELLGAQGHADALLLIEEELQRRKAELRDQDLGHYQSFFGSMAGALQAGGSKMLAISKGFALAEAAVSMWRGAAKALELPFPASLAAWGQVIATGTKALAGIRGASFGGGGGGGGGIGATPVAPVATPSRSLRVNIEGDGMFADALRGSIRQIAEALGEERDIGGFVVA